MVKKPSKRGLPKSMQEALDREDAERPNDDVPLEQFVQEMHGTSVPTQDGKTFPTKEWLQTQFETKSAIIRYLVNQGFEIKDIAKQYGFRYQMVRNIATNRLKRGPNEDWRKPLLENNNIPNPKDFKPVDD